MHLAADKREALPKFEEQLLDMVSQCSFQVILTPDIGDAHEIEQVRVAGGLLGEFGVGGRQRPREVRDRLARTLVQPGVDVVDHDVPAPALINGGLCVPKPQFRVVELLQQCDLMTPRQCCNAALHNCHVRPCCGERSEKFCVGRRDSALTASVGN